MYSQGFWCGPSRKAVASGKTINKKLHFYRKFKLSFSTFRRWSGGGWTKWTTSCKLSLRQKCSQNIFLCITSARTKSAVHVYKICLLEIYCFNFYLILQMPSTVWISSFGRNDFKGIAASMTKKDIQRNIHHLLETMALAIRADKPRNTSRQLMVFDMEDLSLKQITNKSGK